MTPQRQEDIKTIASSIRRIVKGKEGMPMYTNFWDDLDTLLNLILEEEKGE
jgi:hypothetical protein